jgi:hypothetical protein
MNNSSAELRPMSRYPAHASTVFDAHIHLGPYHRFFVADPSGAAMVRIMDRCGVSAGIASSLLGVELDSTEGNAETAALCDTYPDKFAGYVVANPWQDPAGELDRWHDHKSFVGVKVHPDLHGYPLDGPRYEPVWNYAERTGRPVLTHTWAGSEFDDLAHVDRVAEQHPRVWLLAGHSGVAPGSFDRAVDVARRHPRVVLELCGSHNHGRAVAHMVRELGTDQVVYGSDFPFIDLRMSLGRVVFADLTDAERAAVMGGTMLRLLTLGGSTAPIVRRLHQDQAD